MPARGRWQLCSMPARGRWQLCMRPGFEEERLRIIARTITWVEPTIRIVRSIEDEVEARLATTVRICCAGNELGLGEHYAAAYDVVSLSMASDIRLPWER